MQRMQDGEYLFSLWGVVGGENDVGWGCECGCGCGQAGRSRNRDGDRNGEILVDVSEKMRLPTPSAKLPIGFSFCGG